MSLPEDARPSAFVGAPPPLQTPRTAEPAAAVEVSDGDLIANAMAPKGSRAVVYLRVSSKGQVNTDYDPEGISIPAQRISCQRKAEQLGLSIVAEYVEAGQSATEMTKRVEFQRMLERIRRDRDVDYVIVYKLSRFARNRTDDAIVMADLQKRGVTLVSATEQIDATPVGQLMHGILAAFNEYRSREDGADIAYKMGQKAKNGGTLGKAPIGYVNTIERVDGRDVRSIAVDPERAPFVKLAFELYATNKYTFQDIADELTDRGLLTRATARWPAGPITDSKVHRLLSDRYYLGEVHYKGEHYDGRHEPIIEKTLFEKVQLLLDSRGNAHERRRKHDHYLKGSIWCGRCRLEDQANRRLILANIKQSNGRQYTYFFCRGTQDGTCDSPYSAVDRVEDAIANHYKTLTFRPEFVAAIRKQLEAALRDQTQAQHLLREQARAQLARLATKEDNLLELASDGELDTAKVRARLREISREKREMETQLADAVDDLEPGLRYIDSHLKLLEHPFELYQFATDQTRRMLNQAIFEHIYIANDEVVGDEIRSPLRELLATQRGWTSAEGGASFHESLDAAHRELDRHAGVNEGKQSISEDALLAAFDIGFGLFRIPSPQGVGDSSKPSLVRLSGADSKKSATPVGVDVVGWMGVFGRFADWRFLGRTPEELEHLVCRLPAPLADAVPRAEASKGWALERRLPPEVIEQVDEDYRNGSTCRELAKKHGVSVSAVEALLKRRGVTLRGAYRRPKLTEEQKTEAVARYAGGASSHTVSAEFGVSTMTVMNLVREAGVRVHGTWPDPAILAIAEERYGGGLSVEQIAVELGFKKTTMLRAMKEAGIQLRPKGRRSISIGSEQ